MTLNFDLFWSFRSPYSYLATPRIVDIEKRYDVHVNVRPVLPLAVRDDTFFDRINPLWPPYLLIDTTRIAQREGMDYGWPRPDPVVQDLTTRQVASEQPYIYRLTRLGVAASQRGRGLPFIHEVSQIIFSGRVDGWHEGDHLARASERAGVALPGIDAEIASDTQRFDDTIRENQDALHDAGHWGVPTMVFAGEPFFGQDRIDLLLWRMRQEGLTER